MVKSILPTKLTALFSSQAKVIAEFRRDLNQLDRDIIEKQNRLTAVRDAPVSREEVDDRVDRFLLAQEVEARSFFSGEIISSPNGGAFRCGIDVSIDRRNSSIGALIILGFRDVIRDNLIREAVEAAKGEAISSVDREAEVKRLQSEIADLEKTRERFTREAEGHDIKIPRSEYADPAALLAPDSEL